MARAHTACPVPADTSTGCPRVALLLAEPLTDGRRNSLALLLHQALAAHSHASPAHSAHDAFAGDLDEILALRQRSAPLRHLFRKVENGLGERVVAAALQGPRKRSSLLQAHGARVADNMPHDSRTPPGEGACFVEDNCRQTVSPLQRVSTLDQHAVRGAHSGGKASTRPAVYHTANVSTETARIQGTKTAEMRSAKACTGAFTICACSTRRTMVESAVSAPTRVVRIRSSRPPTLTVPPIKASPSTLETGRLSPVTMDSSAWLLPSWTTPSAGKCAPGATPSRSPTCTRRLSITRSSR